MRYNKGTFVHEMIEEEFALAGIIDPVLLLFRQHADPRVIEEELLFDALMGEDAVRETQAVYAAQRANDDTLLSLSSEYFAALQANYERLRGPIAIEVLRESLGAEGVYYRMLNWAVDNGFDDYLRIATERWGETNYRTLVAGARAPTETVAQAADAANDALKGLPDHISDKDLRIYKSPVTSRDAEGKDLSKADMIHRLNQLRVAINAQIAPVDVSLTRDQQTVIAVMEKIRMIEEALAPAGARAAARESVAELMRRVYD